MNHYKSFYLVRHGLATHSKRGYGRRIITAPILPEGIPAIQKIADFLKNISDSINISSEYLRCRETSAIISQITDKPFRFDKRLDEHNHETIGQIRARVQDFLSDASHLPQNNIILCTHGIIIAAIKHILVEEQFVTRQKHDYPQTGELVIVREGQVETINFN